jgi:hypothetical protein
LSSTFLFSDNLEMLCCFHSLWPWVKLWLAVGVQYLLHSISETKWLAGLQANYNHGNHHSTNFNKTQLTNMLERRCQSLG